MRFSILIIVTLGITSHSQAQIPRARKSLDQTGRLYRSIVWNGPATPGPLRRVTVNTPRGPREYRYRNINGVAIADGDVSLGPAEYIDSLSSPLPPDVGLLVSLRPPNLQIPPDLTQLSTIPQTALRNADVPTIRPFAAVTDRVAAWSLWPGGKIPYVIGEDIQNPERVENAILNWNARMPVRWVPYNGNEFHRVEFIRWGESLGFSDEGRSIFPLQYIGVPDGENFRVLHEMGHASGLYHEAQRPDRDDFINVHRECIRDEWRFGSQFDLVSDNALSRIPYDFDSIMHYDSMVFSRRDTDSPCPTLTKKNGDLIFQSTTLSNSDINGMYALYGHFAGGHISRNANFGCSMATGDFDGDGFTDAAIGSTGGRVGGAIYLLKGTPVGLVPWRVLDQRPLGANEDGDDLGKTLCTGDFNGDGITDLAASVPEETISSEPVSRAGGVVVYLGSRQIGLVATRFITQSALGLAVSRRNFGRSLAAGDFDADGHDELVIGDDRRDTTADAGTGAAFVVKVAADRVSLVRQLSIADFGENPIAGDRFAFSLAVGDWSNDGVDDLVVGSPYRDNRGAIFLYRSQSGNLTASGFRGPGSLGNGNGGDTFGWSLSFGEISTNRRYLAVGAVTSGTGGGGGRVFVLSGPTLSEVVRIPDVGGAGNEQEDLLGWSVSPAQLIAGGADELVVGSLGEGFNGSRIHDGHIFTFKRESNGTWSFISAIAQPASNGPRANEDGFGHAIATVRQGTRRGTPDRLLISAPMHTLRSHTSLQTRSGDVHLFSPNGIGVIQPVAFFTQWSHVPTYESSIGY